jgi:hypothetical protein
MQNKKALKTVIIAVLKASYENGAGRDRTDDPQTASLMLSQLSYSPNKIHTAYQKLL